MATKSAAARASKTKVVARSSKPPKQPGAGNVAFGATSGLGVNARLGTAGADPNVGASSPNYATPSAMGVVTPIAAPPVVQDPFLTSTDLANQALELSDV